VVTIVEWYEVAMIFWRTCIIPKEDVIPRLHYCDSRCSQTCRRRSDASRWHSQTCQRSQTYPQRFQTCPQRSQTCPSHSQTCRRGSQVHPKFSLALWGFPKLITITPMALLYQSSEISVTLKATRNARLRSNTLLILTPLSLHSTSSQILLEAPRD